MHWFRQIFARRRIYDGLSEEIQQHPDERIATLIADGISREKAASRAKREFGIVTRIEESGREAWLWLGVGGVLADAKFAARRLRNSPGFAATAILTLALGIGANVVVFSVLNGLILRPLNVPGPQNLFQICRDNTGGGAQSYPDYKDYRDRDLSFSGILAYGHLRVGLSVGKSTVQSWGYSASGNYFDVLGVQPAIGRLFHATDEHGLASAPYLVISYDFWQRQFDASPEVLGQTVQINKHPFTVIGVAPRDFRGTSMIGNGQGETEIPVDPAKQVPRASKGF